MPVAVDGYEYGITEEVSVELVKVRPKANVGVWWAGEHDEDSNGSLELVCIHRYPNG